jgi:apolipoprotein N-acyltransferase
VVSVVFLIGLIVFGRQRQQYWEHAAASWPCLRTAIIQVDPSYVDSIAKMRERTCPIDERLDLVCWPESTLGVYRFDLQDFRNEDETNAKSLAPRVDVHPAKDIACELLAGGKSFSADATEEGPFFQTAFLIRPDEQITARYLKRTLMPFGEYVPGQQFLPSLRRLVDLDDIMLTGKAAQPLVLKSGARIGILMCYEDTVPQNARETVLQGAQALFSLANASAFESPLTLEQHMRLSLLRSVENRRYVARCSATGVSCIISASGAIVTRANTLVEATLVTDLPLNDTLTVYSRYGYLFAPACMLITVLYLVGEAVRRRTRQKQTTPE